jgi:hypothetical protein
VLDFCEELQGVWSWGEDIPFPDIIEYLASFENNKSKNLKLAYIASNFYQYCSAYGLNDERKQVVRQLYAKKQPVNNQKDLDMALKHIEVFINDEYNVEEALLHSEYGTHYKLQYYNNTHGGLGRPLTWEELQEPDFINEDGYLFEAKMCWEEAASKFKGNEANIKYEIDPKNFNEQKFLDAFNELPQTKAMHKAPLCFCLVKKKATFGYVIGVTIKKIDGVNCGTSAKFLGPLKVNYFRANSKFI